MSGGESLIGAIDQGTSSSRFLVSVVPENATSPLDPCALYSRSSLTRNARWLPSTRWRLSNSCLKRGE